MTRSCSTAPAPPTSTSAPSNACRQRATRPAGGGELSRAGRVPVASRAESGRQAARVVAALSQRAGPPRALSIPYVIPHQSIRAAGGPAPIGQTRWSTVNRAQHAFCVESFVDEMAAAARQDPLEFRRRLLPPRSRERRVLDTAAAIAEWGARLPPRHGRGLSLIDSGESRDGGSGRTLRRRARPAAHTSRGCGGGRWGRRDGRIDLGCSRPRPARPPAISRRRCQRPRRRRRPPRPHPASRHAVITPSTRQGRTSEVLNAHSAFAALDMLVL